MPELGKLDEGRLLVLSDALRGRLHLARVPGVHAAPGDAEALPVLQTDRIDEHHLLDFPRIEQDVARRQHPAGDRKSTRLNSSHGYISYAVFCLKKKKMSTSEPPQ